MQDVKGKVLTKNDPYVVIKESELRDFKRANKKNIADGIIIETKEPDWDQESPNSIDDDKAEELVKNLFALKKALPFFTSDVPIRKLLEAAETQKRPAKTIEIIKKRLVEITGEDDEEVTEPTQMLGVY
jgi:hypothetical protein